jgi:hypothetical protein
MDELTLVLKLCIVRSYELHLESEKICMIIFIVGASKNEFNITKCMEVVSICHVEITHNITLPICFTVSTIA